jgi:predicted anti-sigma-YlaC factor YlaD
LDDYLDGELGEAEFQEVELHLAGCEACRQEERAVRAVVALAAALPRTQEPPRDLWPGIADEIARRRRFTLVRSAMAGPAVRWAAGLAAAAAVVAAVWVVRRETPPAPEVARSGQGAAVQPVSLGTTPDAFTEAERDYQRATAELMSALQARRASLSPKTSASIDENLRVIDRALADIRAALERDPANPRLNRMLASTHEKKIETLRRVLKLTT